MASRSARDKAEREARRRARSFSIRQRVHELRGRRRRRDDVIAAIVFVVAVGLATTAQVGYFTAGPGAPKPAKSATSSASPTPAATRTLAPKSLAGNRTWTGTMAINDFTLGISLDGKKAPQAVANFVDLVDSGFYVGLTCHRLTTSGLYVLQCGDPNGDGTGGPGYTFGPLENVPKSTVTVSGTKEGVYPAGTIAMARGTTPDSQGSQFFIVYRTSELPAPGYTVFGKVTSGLSTLKTDITSKGTSDGSTDGTPKVATDLGVIAVK